MNIQSWDPVVDRKINQFGDYEDTSNMKPEDWDYRWGKSQTQFHMPKIHPYVDMILPLFNFFVFLTVFESAKGFPSGAVAKLLRLYRKY